MRGEGQAAILSMADPQAKIADMQRRADENAVLVTGSLTNDRINADGAAVRQSAGKWTAVSKGFEKLLSESPKPVAQRNSMNAEGRYKAIDAANSTGWRNRRSAR